MILACFPFPLINSQFTRLKEPRITKFAQAWNPILSHPTELKSLSSKNIKLWNILPHFHISDNLNSNLSCPCFDALTMNFNVCYIIWTRQNVPLIARAAITWHEQMLLWNKNPRNFVYKCTFYPFRERPIVSCHVFFGRNNFLANVTIFENKVLWNRVLAWSLTSLDSMAVIKFTLWSFWIGWLSWKRFNRLICMSAPYWFMNYLTAICAERPSWDFIPPWPQLQNLADRFFWKPRVEKIWEGKARQ